MSRGFLPEWMPGEEDAFRQIAELAEQYGYGNCVAHLLREWQLLLMKNGLSEDAAQRAVLNRKPYALDQHRPRNWPKEER